MAEFRSLSSKSWAFAIVIAVVAGAVAYYLTRPANIGGPSAPPGAGDPIQRKEIGTVLSPDAIRAIDNPSFDSGSGVLTSTRVIAVELGGESHAFPIATLSEHEIVNDRLGGKNIAITW
jgi:hypothetical protein